MEIIQGQIWKIITDNFYDSGEMESYRTDTLIKNKIKKGTFIEIRYPYAWHWRANYSFKENGGSGSYGHSTAKSIVGNCILFGRVQSEVSWLNSFSINEILEKELYEKYNIDKFENMNDNGFFYIIEKTIKSAKRIKAENNFENWDINRYIKNSLFSFFNKAKEINATNVLNKFNSINSDYGVVFK